MFPDGHDAGENTRLEQVTPDSAFSSSETSTVSTVMPRARIRSTVRGHDSGDSNTSHNAARILRREKEFGSLQKGLSADILIVEGNPAKNVSHSRKVRHVFLRGKQVDRDSLKLRN